MTQDAARVMASDILHASILVVDDQAADVSLLEQMLRGAGYTSIASTMGPVAATSVNHVVGLHDLGRMLGALAGPSAGAR